MELSKKDKKTARQIIEKGLQAEFDAGISKFDKILQQWRGKTKNSQDSYYALYKAVMSFDKHIARRYDNMSGSKYLLIIACQFHDKVISENDLLDFPEEVQDRIRMMADFGS